jgi:hypothetical protein
LRFHRTKLGTQCSPADSQIGGSDGTSQRNRAACSHGLSHRGHHGRVCSDRDALKSQRSGRVVRATPSPTSPQARADPGLPIPEAGVPPVNEEGVASRPGWSFAARAPVGGATTSPTVRCRPALHCASGKLVIAFRDPKHLAFRVDARLFRGHADTPRCSKTQPAQRKRRPVILHPLVAKKMGSLPD